jgi:hypothetical protein
LAVGQAVWDGTQDRAQVPLEHTCPAAHFRPQMPQLFGSFWKLVQ